MSKKSEYKENSGSKSFNESIKRRKMNENFNLSKSDLDNDTSADVTVYEDNPDIQYFNKSAKSRLLNISHGKRSPLAVLNKTSKSSSQQPVAGPSNSNQGPSTSNAVKQAAIIDEAFLRRHQTREALPDPFQLLADEIVLQILSYLPKKALARVATVNSRFSRIVKDETLWVRLDLGHKVISQGSLEVMLSRGLVVLRLASAKIQCPAFVPDFDTANFESKLQFLDLSMTNIDTNSLQKLLATCYSLKKLSLEFVPVDEDVCRELAHNAELEVLNLTMCQGLTREGIRVMLLGLQNLSALNISWTGISKNCLWSLVEHISPSVNRLNIAGCRKSLLDSHIKRISQRCTNLVELDVSDGTMLTSACIPHISNLKALEFLSLSRCYNISMTSYLNLNNMQSLLFLNVFGLLSDSGLVQLAKNFSKKVGINRFHHSSIGRPTITPRRTSVWGVRTRDLQ